MLQHGCVENRTRVCMFIRVFGVCFHVVCLHTCIFVCMFVCIFVCVCLCVVFMFMCVPVPEPRAVGPET